MHRVRQWARRGLQYWWRPLLVWLVVVGTSAIVVAQSECRERQTRVDEFTLRTTVAGNVLATYLDDQEALLHARAQDLLSGTVVSPRRLQVVTSGLGFAGGGVFDSKGRLLMISPYVPALIGHDYSTLEHVHKAMVTNQPAVSQVLISPALQTPVVGIAVPLETSGGRRIITGVLRMDGSQLTSLLRTSANLQATGVYLVDHANHVIADGARLKAMITPLAIVAPSLAQSLTSSPNGTYSTGGTSNLFVSTAVDGTGWRLITVVQTARLYQSLVAGEMLVWLLTGALWSAAFLAALWYGIGAHRRTHMREMLIQEREMARSSARLRQIIEMLPEALILYNASGERVSLNRAATALLGVDLLGQPLAQDFNSARRMDSTPYANNDLPVLRSMRTGEAIVGEQMLLRNLTTGNDTPILLSSGPLRAEEGTIEGSVAVMQDISSIKASEREREQLLAQTEAARQRLQQIVDVLPEVLIVYDADARVVLMNQAAQALFPGSAVGQQRGDLDPVVWQPNGTALSLDELPTIRALKMGETSRGIQVLLRDTSTGRQLPFLTGAAPLRDATGAITGAVSFGQDISPLKELERQRDRVLATVTHDLRNPLTSITGMSQLLQMRTERLDAPVRASFVRSLQSIEMSARRMTAQIGELLDHARVQAGHPIDLSREPTDIIALVRGVMADHQQSTELHSLELRAAHPSIVVDVDPLRLERALANLIVNAIKYSPRGGPIVITVDRVVEPEGIWLNIAVADRGLGIPAADLPHIFEQYYRASNVASSIPGTGIGLAGVRHLVERHGGTVTLDSTEGVGTTVTIRLPLSHS